MHMSRILCWSRRLWLCRYFYIVRQSLSAVPFGFHFSRRFPPIWNKIITNPWRLQILDYWSLHPRSKMQNKSLVFRIKDCTARGFCFVSATNILSAPVPMHTEYNRQDWRYSVLKEKKDTTVASMPSTNIRKLFLCNLSIKLYVKIIIIRFAIKHGHISQLARIQTRVYLILHGRISFPTTSGLVIPVPSSGCIFLWRLFRPIDRWPPEVGQWCWSNPTWNR